MSGTVAAISIIPTLDALSQLSDPRDILAYVLRWYATVPKSISDSTPTSIISMIDTISKYQNTPSRLIDAITTDLQSVYTNYFGTGVTTVNVSTEDNGDGTYNVTVELSTSVNGTSYALGANISVDNDGNLLLKYHPSLT